MAAYLATARGASSAVKQTRRVDPKSIYFGLLFVSGVPIGAYVTGIFDFSDMWTKLVKAKVGSAFAYKGHDLEGVDGTEVGSFELYFYKPDGQRNASPKIPVLEDALGRDRVNLSWFLYIKNPSFWGSKVSFRISCYGYFSGRVF